MSHVATRNADHACPPVRLSHTDIYNSKVKRRKKQNWYKRYPGHDSEVIGVLRLISKS